MLKVVRIRRLPILINRLNMKQEAKAAVKIIQMFFFLFLYLHLAACAWFFVVSQNAIWIPSMDQSLMRTDVRIISSHDFRFSRRTLK